MRISRKIGLSFFVTFLLVIALGVLSIYSLRQIYRGLGQVFSRDLPASRFTYELVISMEDALSGLNNFLITGNENFKISYKDSYKKVQADILSLNRFISGEGERVALEEISTLAQDIDRFSLGIFERQKKLNSLFKDVRIKGDRFTQKLDDIFDFEEKKMQGEKDFLLIQAQHIPASRLIMDSRLSFSSLIDGLAGYGTKNGEDASSSTMTYILALEKSIKDYKNYYGYALSDKERAIATELIGLSSEITLTVSSIIALRTEIETLTASLLAKEKDFMDAVDSIIADKKSGISSKLGVGASLTEDIPAIHNLLKLEKDMTESLRLSTRYMLSSKESHKILYYQLRQDIDKGLRDYERHARLRGTESFLEDILESDKAILEAIDSNIKMFEKEKKIFSELALIETGIKKRIDGLLGHKDSLIKKKNDPKEVLDKFVPARWILMRLRSELSAASRLVLSYLTDHDAQYKDMYSERYFNMKKYLNRYRSVSSSERDSSFIKEIEPALDMFNTAVLDAIDNHDKIMTGTGRMLAGLEGDLKDGLEKAVEFEITQIQKNKRDLMNKAALINTLIFLIIGVVAIISIFIIFYTANSITIPIRKLYSGAEIIGRGNLDHRLDIKTGDEIQELAEGFNNMAGELKELYTNLENKVKKRTSELAEANEALARINKELDDFTYTVSHDLKEPLRGVKAFTKLLAEDYSDKFDKEGKEHLKVISESSTRMGLLIEDLLNLSRIGRIRNIERDVDLNALLSDVKKNLAYSLEEKHADLRIAKNFPRVTCDRIRIGEVFSNLISNAIKYSRKDKKPVIEVGYRDKGEFYEFSVKDNGIGIEKEYHDKVFQIFQRLHAKGEYEGTGAGLTIVKKIIENHDGQIYVESELGEGSRFYFTVPKKG